MELFELNKYDLHWLYYTIPASIINALESTKIENIDSGHSVHISSLQVPRKAIQPAECHCGVDAGPSEP